MELLSDPGPRWTPSTKPPTATSSPPTQNVSQTSIKASQHEPPFYIARDDRVIALMMTVMDERSPYLDPYTIRFIISTPRLLEFMDRTSDSVPFPTFAWPEWGPRCTRAEPKNDIWDGSWPCCVYGTKIITESSWVEHHNGQIARYRPVNLNPPDYDTVVGSPQIYDFNQAALKHALMQSPILWSQASQQQGSIDYQDVKPLHLNGFDYYLQPTHLPSDFAKFFDDPDNVVTTLPYRVCRTQIAPPREDAQNASAAEANDPKVKLGNVNSVMLSGDSIVLVRVSTFASGEGG